VRLLPDTDKQLLRVAVIGMVMGCVWFAVIVEGCRDGVHIRRPRFFAPSSRPGLGRLGRRTRQMQQIGPQHSLQWHRRPTASVAATLGVERLDQRAQPSPTAPPAPFPPETVLGASSCRTSRSPQAYVALLPLLPPLLSINASHLVGR